MANMPTMPRRPAAQRDAAGSRPAGCAAPSRSPPASPRPTSRQLGVSAQAVSVWHRRWRTGGTDGLRSKGPSGPPPRLSDAQLAEVEQALLADAMDNGFVGELWAGNASGW
jgi:Helix-turn-helix domain